MLPQKVHWADVLWSSHSLIMMGIGGWLINDYPARLGAKKMDGPFKWWALVSVGFVVLNGLPLIPWAFYLVYE